MSGSYWQALRLCAAQTQVKNAGGATWGQSTAVTSVHPGRSDLEQAAHQGLVLITYSLQVFGINQWVQSPIERWGKG